MGYYKEIYENAYAQLEKRKLDAEYDNDRRIEEAQKMIPGLSDLRRELKTTGFAMVAESVRSSGDVKRLSALQEKAAGIRRKISEKLLDAGLPSDYLEVRYACPECSDTGYKGNEVCSCFSLLLKQEAYRQLGNASDTGKYTFDSFSLEYYGPYRDTMSETLKICRDYADTFSPSSESILMIGGVGLGKTHLSLAIAGELIDKGFGVVYTGAQNMFSRLEAERFGYDNPAPTQNRDEYKRLILDCDLLIIDDLGCEFPTSFTSASIYDIVNSRLVIERPTIINTNLSLQQLKERYTERLVSRITCGYIPLMFYGKDIRMQKRSQNM